MLLLFFHRHPLGWQMFAGQPRSHPTMQVHHGFLRSCRWLCYSICIGVVVWSFMFCWTCRFILGACPLQILENLLGLSIFHRSIMDNIRPMNIIFLKKRNDCGVFILVVHLYVFLDKHLLWAEATFLVQTCCSTSTKQ